MKTLIAIVIIIGLAAVAGSIIVGVKSFDGTVTENPYETGLHWDDMQRNMRKLGWTVTIQNEEFVTGDNDVLVAVFDKNHMPLYPAEVALQISRPSAATYTKKFDIIQVREGLYSARLNFPLFGLWDIGIHIASGKESLRFEKRVFVKNRGGTS